MTSCRGRIGIIVFARCDSKRLPGKVLLPIGKRPILGHVLDRLRRMPEALPLIVATSDRSVDDRIATFAQQEHVLCFRGDALDVARRALDCAKAFELTDLIRVSGDSPFIDPDVVACIVEAHKADRADLTTNVHPRTFPYGCSVELITVDALTRVLALTADHEDREHVTNYCYRAGDQFRIRNIAAGHDRYLGVRLVVDTEEDLERAQWITNRAQPSATMASLDEIVSLAKSWGAENASLHGDTVRT